MTLIDSQIGPYKVKKIIGQSLFSTVCLATDTAKIRDVVLKVFAQSSDDPAAELERFTQEAQNVERLNHPNILSFHEAGEANGEHFIALEFVTERTLSNYLEEQGNGRLPLDDTIGIVQQIAAALDYAHDQGFVHRNLKPETLLYTEDGRVLISDFSLAKHVDSKDSRSIITIAGSSLGELDYISPEQAEGEIKIDHRSDVYSLAVLAYKLCSNKLPHSGSSQYELLHQIIYEAPPSLERLVPEIPAGVSYAISRALSKDIPVRYGKATSFAEALEEGKTWEPSPTAYEFLATETGPVQTAAASHTGYSAPNATFDAHVPPERKQSKMPLLLSILVGLIGLSIASLYLISQQVITTDTPNHSTGEAVAPAGSIPTIENESATLLDGDQAAKAPDSDSLDAVVDNIIQNALSDTAQVEGTEVVQVDATGADVKKEGLTVSDSEWLAPYSQYRDPENRFILEVPALWRRNVSVNSVNFDSTEPFARIFVRNMGASDPDRSAEALIQQYIGDNANSFNNLALIENSSKRTENEYLQQEYGAVWLNKEVTLDLIAISGEDQSYILGLVAELDIDEEINASFEKIVDSFKLNSTDQSNRDGQRDETEGDSVAAISSTPSTEEVTAVTPSQTATRTSIPTETTTSSPTATKTPLPVATRTSSPTRTPSPTATRTPIPVAAILDFEEFGSWQLGTLPWGTFTQSAQQAYSGEYAGQFIYDFPVSSGNQNYLAFYRPLPVEGEPDALSMQVYGDGSGVFLHVWIRDAANQLWQFTFGNVEHVGWQEMVAPFDRERGVPNGILGGNSSALDTIQYPITFFALSVDGVDNGVLQAGTIYVDDLSISAPPQ